MRTCRGKLLLCLALCCCACLPCVLTCLGSGRLTHRIFTHCKELISHIINFRSFTFMPGATFLPLDLVNVSKFSLRPDERASFHMETWTLVRARRGIKLNNPLLSPAVAPKRQNTGMLWKLGTATCCVCGRVYTRTRRSLNTSPWTQKPTLGRSSP